MILYFYFANLCVFHFLFYLIAFVLIFLLHMDFYKHNFLNNISEILDHKMYYDKWDIFFLYIKFYIYY